MGPAHLDCCIIIIAASLSKVAQLVQRLSPFPRLMATACPSVQHREPEAALEAGRAQAEVC